MKEQQTCGKGLAEHSALPAKLAELIASTMRNLELHMETLDLTDPNSRREYEAYQKLVKEHQEISTRLKKTAREMEGYRDLPMGRHDQKKLSDPLVIDAFKKYTNLEQELLTILNKQIEQDQEMIAEVYDHK
jgi:hypothetical protein